MSPRRAIYKGALDNPDVLVTCPENLPLVKNWVALAAPVLSTISDAIYQLPGVTTLVKSVQGEHQVRFVPLTSENRWNAPSALPHKELLPKLAGGALNTVKMAKLSNLSLSTSVVVFKKAPLLPKRMVW